MTKNTIVGTVQKCPEARRLRASDRSVLGLYVRIASEAATKQMAFFNGPIKFLFLVVCFLFAGCSLFEERKMGQAAMKHFETRHVDAPFEEVYAAATEALFDLGYTVTHSDKESGILVGEKRQKKPPVWVWGSPKEDTKPKEEFDTLELTLLVKSSGKKETKVRIKTAVNKETKLDKKAIDEAWVYIQRQVLMEE